jgi:hypothetical protein
MSPPPPEGAKVNDVNRTFQNVDFLMVYYRGIVSALMVCLQTERYKQFQKQNCKYSKWKKLWNKRVVS